MTPYAISGLHFRGYSNKLRHYLTVIPKVIFQIWILFFLFKVLPHFWKLTTSLEKYLFNVLIWGGVLWLVVMKNLSHYHEYVSLYLVGLSLVFYYYLVNWLDSKGKNPLKIAIGVFSVSLLINCLREIPVSRSVAWQIPEFEKLRTQISGKNGAKVYFDAEGRTNFLHGVPYLESFFLSGRDTLTYLRDEANFLVKLKDNKLIIHEEIK
jgi:hypothetical protein